MGQRCKTISGFFENGLIYNFVKEKCIHKPEKMSLLVYDNVEPNTNVRLHTMNKSITNTTQESILVFHIYVREHPRSGK